MSSCPIGCFPLVVAADVRAKGSNHPEVGERLVGEAALQAHACGHRPAAELRASRQGQEGAEEAESGGPFRGALQEAQRRHGEQNSATPAEDKRAGESFIEKKMA